VTVAGTVSAMLQRTPRLFFGDPLTKKIKAIPELDTLELADCKKRDRAAEPGPHSFEQQELKCLRSTSTGTRHSRSCHRRITDRSCLPRHVVFRSRTRRWPAFETSTTWYVFCEPREASTRHCRQQRLDLRIQILGSLQSFGVSVCGEKTGHPVIRQMNPIRTLVDKNCHWRVRASIWHMLHH
jgi:hypothetical protein